MIRLGVYCSGPPNPSRLLEHRLVGPWMHIATALTATEFTEDNRAGQIGSPLEVIFSNEQP